MTRREIFDLLMKCGGERRATSDDWLEPFVGAILAYAAAKHDAAPKWHPVSEPVPRHGNYWTRTVHGNTILWGRIDANFKFNPDAYTHWCGPIEPPPFQEKPPK